MNEATVRVKSLPVLTQSEKLLQDILYRMNWKLSFHAGNDTDKKSAITYIYIEGKRYCFIYIVIGFIVEAYVGYGLTVWPLWSKYPF